MKHFIARHGLLAAMACTAPLSHGAGFAVHELGTGIGLAYANATAGAQDASSLHGNPASMTYLTSGQVVVGASYIGFNPKFRVQQASTHLVDRRTGAASTIDPMANPDPASGFLHPSQVPDAVTGTLTGQASASGTVPYLFWHSRYTGGLHVGLGITVPFAADSRFNEEWAGRVSDTLSVGAGLDFLYVDTRLEKAVDFRYEAAALEAFAGSVLPRIDGKAVVRGNAWAAGFNWGVIFSPSDAIRAGIAYRSAMTPHLKGSYEVTVPEVYANLSRLIFGSDVFGSQRRDAGGSLNLPSSLSAGIHADLTPRLSLMADWMRTSWSRLQELRIRVDGGDIPDQVQVQRWRDTNRFAVGMSYALDERWNLQAGLAYDQTPVSSPQFRHPGAPDADRRNLALGAAYRAGKGHAFSAGIMLTRPRVAKVRFSDTLANPVNYPFDANQVFDLDGHFDLEQKTVSLNYTYAFQ